MHTDLRRFGRHFVLSTVILTLADSAAYAGSLDPPGAPGSTMKPLDQVEPRVPISSVPFTISAPGSYYLTRDLNIAAGSAHGISIEASHVTLDLQGFSLVGPGSGTGLGIFVTSLPKSNISIVNGTVRSWGSTGVYVENAPNTQLRGLRVSGNGGHGVVAGSDSRISDCMSSGNGFDGIRLASGTVSDCIVSFNGGDGIWVATNSYVVGNRCIANGNTSDGAGIHVTGDTSRIEGNHVLLNDRGLDVDTPGNLIVKNSARGNTTANFDIAAGNAVGEIITLGAGGTITEAESAWANFQY